MSSRTLLSKTLLLWTLLLTMTLCYGVNAAPEAFHRRQGDGSLVFSHPDLHDLKDHDLAENIVQDPKHQEELAALIDWLQQVQNWQQQGTEDDRNGLESGVIPPSEGYPNLPIPLPLLAKYFRSQDGVSKEDVKRGSYTPPLCYFKICNMGRKRILR